jgi:hypothetical protein
MHRYECDTHNFLFNLENQTMDFSYTIFLVKKVNVGKILKLLENRYLNILSIHILKLEISGCDNNGPSAPYPRTVRTKMTVRTHLADRLADF